MRQQHKLQLKHKLWLMGKSFTIWTSPFDQVMKFICQRPLRRNCLLFANFVYGYLAKKWIILKAWTYTLNFNWLMANEECQCHFYRELDFIFKMLILNETFSFIQINILTGWACIHSQFAKPLQVQIRTIISEIAIKYF